MSHFHERKEKNCLNCGAEVAGKYCQHCGQENIEPHQSFWQLLKHYIEDLTHFDGKFFSSTGSLISRPGFLPAEFIKGRRVSYLNPIRMYIFTSALFFFIFFSSKNEQEKYLNHPTPDLLGMDAVQKMDSASFAAYTRALNLTFNNQDVSMSRSEYQQYIEDLNDKGFSFSRVKYPSRAALDSAIASGKEHNISWFEKKLRYREIDLRNKYKENYPSIGAIIQDKFLHSLPQLLFISLPLTALVLLLLYSRHNQYFYADHFIFSLYLYIFLFLVLLVDMMLKKLDSISAVSIFDWIDVGLWLWTWVYVFLALKTFYKQSWAATILKFILLGILAGIMIILLFIISLLIFLLFFV